MPLVVFEPTILVSERPQTHALDRTVTRIGIKPYNNIQNVKSNSLHNM
jgi:hypothetical protein